MNNLTVKVIKTEQQYKDYLSEVEFLIGQSAKQGTEISDRLDLLTVLIENYEEKIYQVEAIDPIDAIKFRMEEKGLKQVDLAPYIGTKSRVSEVLSRKRPLTISMIRSLSIGLGISVEVLVGIEDQRATSKPKSDLNWSRFPIKEMVTRGWIDKTLAKGKATIEEQVKGFIEQLSCTTTGAAFKRTLSGDAYSPVTKYSLYAWLARVVEKSREQKNRLGVFNPEALPKSFLTELAKLSWSEYGPLLAIEYLEKNGISVVIEPSLKGTLVDGAALKDKDGTPIIALTLRHDRLDNFWFTLLHETVHILRHIGTDETFIDDLDHQTENKIEAEANRVARDTFIPRIVWKRSNAYLTPTKSSIDMLSRELRIHPAIIAGRIRRESGNYTQFSDLVGYGEVRKHFHQVYEK